VKNPAGVRAFGIHLRRLREMQNLSQQELADLADVAKITVQRIENAKFSATIDVLISLARALNVPVKQLVDYPVPKERKK
jgi:transcriptional regulator with XRE-family HTH domain